MAEAWLTSARRQFHDLLLSSILTRSDKGVPSNADNSSKPSKDFAMSVLDQLGQHATTEKMAGQTAGSKFEGICATFVETCLGYLSHLRPGRFRVTLGPNISDFDQYQHLADLKAIAKANRELATAIGSDYLIKPDIVISRSPEPDTTINFPGPIVDSNFARLTPLRSANQGSPILHASLSCKWTLRSDRAQNARSEGLNLVRNRKGRLPHIAVVTGEPMPSRIASLALGTGDIDCVYHFALPELMRAVQDSIYEDAAELLLSMVEGKRLRDISYLPLDLVT